MALTLTLILYTLLKSMNPIMMAISILMISILGSYSLYTATLVSWASFVLILAFSSGMMTLFLYAASLSSNEKVKTQKSKTMLMTVLFISMIMTSKNKEAAKESMKLFSNKIILILMMMMIITTMLALSYHGHHPNQALSSSF